MARTRKAAKATPAAETTAEPATAVRLAGDAERGTAELEPLPAKNAAAAEPAYAADPHSKISVSLSDVRGGPSMHLLRSHRFNQLQVRFDGQQPDEQHLALLKQAGWRDRTQEEGVWTKQIDRDAKWQSVAQIEQEFKAVANAIRKDKGLGPVLEGLGA
jgi:hypothetical protein